MFVTLDVSKLSGWLNAFADCRVGHATREEVRPERRERALGGGDAIGMHVDCPTQGWEEGTRGAHVEHGAHCRDAGGVPIGNVRVEILQVVEEGAHVGDGRDVPLGDRAVLCNGGSRAGVVRLDRRLQGGLGRESVDKPARAPLPSRKEDTCDVACGVRGRGVMV